MTAEGTTQSTMKLSDERYEWFLPGLGAAIVGVALVLLAQTLALNIWPEAAEFEPLRSYPRMILFTAVPALIASRLLAYLSRRGPNPLGAFYRISAVVLVVSFIPDFLLPLPGKSMAGSTIAAGLHVVAALAIVLVLTIAYRRQRQ